MNQSGTGDRAMSEQLARVAAKRPMGGSGARKGIPKTPLPTGRQDRKDIPLYWGLVNYFRDALIGVAKLSMIGNEQHNPGEPLHWAREKGGDELDAQMRHIFELHGIDIDLVPHSVKNAWRALAVCQLDLEENPWTTSVQDTIELMRQQAGEKTDGAILDETTPLSKIEEPMLADKDYVREDCMFCEDAICDTCAPIYKVVVSEPDWAVKTAEQWVVIETLGEPASGNIRGYGVFPSKEAAQSYGVIVRRASARKNFCSVMRVNDVKNIRSFR